MQILFLRDSFALEKMIHSVGSACNEGHKDVVHFLILNKTLIWMQESIGMNSNY